MARYFSRFANKKSLKDLPRFKKDKKITLLQRILDFFSKK